MSRIEVFTAGCPDCAKALDLVHEAVAPCGCQVIEQPLDSEAAKAYGIWSAPTVVRDGQVVFRSLPTKKEAVAKLRKL